MRRRRRRVSSDPEPLPVRSWNIPSGTTRCSRARWRSSTIEELFWEFPKKKSAAEIIDRLGDRDHLIAMAEAPLLPTIPASSCQSCSRSHTSYARTRPIRSLRTWSDASRTWSTSTIKRYSLSLDRRNQERLARSGTLSCVVGGTGELGARCGLRRSGGEDEEQVLRHARRARQSASTRTSSSTSPTPPTTANQRSLSAKSSASTSSIVIRALRPVESR